MHAEICPVCKGWGVVETAQDVDQLNPRMRG